MNNRRWLINYLVKDAQNFQNMPQFLDEELRICLRCAERYNDNYTAWSQRCWLIDKLNDQKRLLQELRDNEGWLWLHVSDYCGFHFRQHVLKKFGKLWYVSRQINRHQ